MAVTLTSTGIQFPDGTVLTNPQGLTEGTPFTTNGVATATFSSIPSNHQKIILDIEYAPPNSGPVYTTLNFKSQGGTSTFSSNIFCTIKATGGGSGTNTYGGTIIGQSYNYLSYSQITRMILEYVSVNPGTMPYYHLEVYNPYSYYMIGTGSLYNTASGKIDTISLAYSGGYVFSSPKIAISWE